MYETNTMRKKKIMIAASILVMGLLSCENPLEKNAPAEKLTDPIEVSTDIQEESGGEMMISDTPHNSEEWNDILNDYEHYVNSYIAFIKKKKENPTDMAIINEYQELMQEGTEWTSKRTKASSELEFAQLSRMQQIQLKLAAAAF